jgi:hypothetical protein
MMVSAVRPWRIALHRDRCLPSNVVGPVLFDALRRLASICFKELIEDQLEQLASFVRPAKAGVFSRGQTCRGKSQTPRSLDGRVEGNQDSEAHRQGLPWGDHESPGRNESEREVASKTNEPESRARKRRAKAAWGAEI